MSNIILLRGGMDTENNHIELRVGVATVLALVGAAFMSRLPQYIPGQKEIAWYQSGFFWVGLAIVILALLILLIHPKYWKRIWQSIWGFPNWIHKTYIWKRYKPVIVISNLGIETSFVDGMSAPRANFSMSTKGRGKIFSLNFNEQRLLIRQKNEWGRIVSVGLGNTPPPNEYTSTGKDDENKWDITLVTTSRVGSLTYNPPNLKQSYNWEIKGIFITLPIVGRRELRWSGTKKIRYLPTTS